MDTVHIRNDAYICHVCGAKHSCGTQLKVHVENKCSGGDEQRPRRRRGTGPEQRIKCHFCAKKFTRMVDTMRHYNDEHHPAYDERIQLICHYCNDMLPSVADKIAHIRTFKCGSCVKVPLRCAGQWLKHHKMHDGDKTYCCQVRISSSICEI